MKAKTLLGLLVAVLASCSEFPAEFGNDMDGGQTVSVTVSFNDGELMATKSSFSSLGSSIDNVNLWAVSGSSVVSHEYISGRQSVLLSLEKNRTYTFYALVNYYTDIGGGYSTKAELDTFLADLADIDFDDGSRSLPMAGISSPVDLSSSYATVTIPVERLFSKVVFKFSPDADMKAQNVNITGVRLMNSANYMTPFVQYSYTEDTCDGDAASAQDLTDVNAGKGIEFYCFENCCGTTSNTNPRNKLPEYAPNGLPTYLEVTAQLNGFQMTGTVTYRFCIGANNTNDYNLRRNRVYTVTLHSLCSSIEGGDDYWKLDPGDVTYNDGNTIQLYVGQFRKMKLQEDDEVYYYNESTKQWVNFVNYWDDDYYYQTLRNGMNMTTYYGEENGNSCNPEFYFFSTGRISSVDEKVKINHSDGSTDLYTIKAPVIPTSFDDLDDITVLEDGWTNSALTPAVCGTLGTVQASEFRVPAGYLYADFPFSAGSYNGTNLFSLSEMSLPSHLLTQWKEDVEYDSEIKAQLRESKRWSLFSHLYCRDDADNAFFEDDTSEGYEYAAVYFDCLNNAERPRIVFYGLNELDETTTSIQNRLFTQNVSLTVLPAFPSQGNIGERWNYEFAPNSLKSNSGGSLPAGISSYASFTFDDSDVYMYISGKTIRFNFPTSGRAYNMPAGGHYDFSGSVTNPFSKVTKTGDYSVDVILYLPLIGSACVTDAGTNWSVIGATAAVATTRTFRDNTDVWEAVYKKLFNSTIGYKVRLSLNSINETLYPSGYRDDVEIDLEDGCNVSNYTLQWLANYAPVHVSQFVDVATNRTYTSLDIYPSAGTAMRNKLSKMGYPIYAKVVRFADVNTTMTPVYNYYSEGNQMFQLLWGTK